MSRLTRNLWAAAAMALAAAAALPASLAAGQVFKDCADCPELVVIAAGSFIMGSPASEPGRGEDEGQQRRVTLAAFALGRTEVTQGQWKAVMGSNPSSFGNCGDTCPVEGVSWNEAQEFARRLSAKTGKRYRLPSEAEWEYAARAGTTTAYWWGEQASHEYANYGEDICDDGVCSGLTGGRDRWVNTAPVAQFSPNAYGPHDMHGNVWEWVQDVWHDSYAGAPSDGSAWESGANPARRVVRGGSWVNNPRYLRSAKRFGIEPEIRNIYTGLRIARTL